MTTFPTLQAAVSRIRQLIERKLRDDVGLLGDPIVSSYRDVSGNVVGASVRFNLSDGEKAIRQLSVQKGRWCRKAMSDGRPLYRANEIADADVVFVAEGEKGADNLWRIGILATTSCGGSSAAAKTDWTLLDGKTVYIIPDNDAPGQKYLQSVLMLIEEQAITAKVKVIDLARSVEGIQEGEDIADLLEPFGPGEENDAIEIVHELMDKAESPDIQAEPTQASSVDDFKELIELEKSELPQLDLEALPDSFAEPVRKISNSTETPPGLTAMVVLGASGYANSHKFEIEVEPGYSEPANLFMAGIMGPGCRKSEAFRRPIKPVKDFERSLQIPLDAVTCDTGRDSDFLDMEPAPPAEVLELQTDLAPSIQRCICDDFTPEALATDLGNNGQKMLLASAEPDMFNMILGRYSGQPNLNLILKGHDGDAFRENPKGAKGPLVIDRPLISIAIMAQPAAIDAASSKRLLRGRGLLDRFLFVMPKSNLGQRNLSVACSEDLDLSAYEQNLTMLLRNPIRVDSFGEPRPQVVRLNPDSHAIWKGFQRSIESRMVEGGQLHPIAGWASKLPGRVARIALNFALLESGSDVRLVECNIMQSAVAFGEFLIPHALAVLNGVSSDRKTTAAREVVQEIYRSERREISRRDVMRMDRKLRFEDADYVLWLLIEHGCLKPAERTKRPGRPSERYIVRPGLF